jgi:AcrR family transcriptional regulator
VRVSEARHAGEDGDEVRGRLVAAAAEVFAEKGYDGARVQEIAKRAGLTIGAIYGRFTGKAELLRAAIEAHSQSELDDLFTSNEFDGRVTDILTIVGSHLVTRRSTTEQALLLEAFVAARRDPAVKRLVAEIMEERAERLALLVVNAKASAGISGDLDTFSVVRFCHAVGLGFLLFEALDLELPDAGPWEGLVTRVVNALGRP